MPATARNITVFSKKDIQALFKKAQVIFSSPELELRTAPAKGEYGKILIVIPRKAGNAPKRNLMRRRIRTIFYKEQLFDKGLDVIVWVRRPAVGLPFTSLQDILVHTLNKNHD